MTTAMSSMWSDAKLDIAVDKEKLAVKSRTPIGDRHGYVQPFGPEQRIDIAINNYFPQTTNCKYPNLKWLWQRECQAFAPGRMLEHRSLKYLLFHWKQIINRHKVSGYVSGHVKLLTPCKCSAWPLAWIGFQCKRTGRSQKASGSVDGHIKVCSGANAWHGCWHSHICKKNKLRKAGR